MATRATLDLTTGEMVFEEYPDEEVIVPPQDPQAPSDPVVKLKDFLAANPDVAALLNQ